MNDREPAFATIPGFSQIPFLHHGFGNADWKAQDFKSRGEWSDFRLLFLKQMHSDIILFIRRVPRAGLRGDAAVTGLSRVFLIIKTADCLPVLLVDGKTRIIAAVHCGWKGTARRVLEKTVAGMTSRHGCNPRDIFAALGPCIGRSCYEVGEDVRRRFKENHFPASLFLHVPDRAGKYFFDLREANRLQLVSRGLRPENIFSLDVCTHCDANLPSYRRDRDDTGRMLSFIGLSA